MSLNLMNFLQSTIAFNPLVNTTTGYFSSRMLKVFIFVRGWQRKTHLSIYWDRTVSTCGYGEYFGLNSGGVNFQSRLMVFISTLWVHCLHHIFQPIET